MFSPQELAYLQKNSVYRFWSRQTISGITVADLVTAIKAITTTEPESLVLLKYLYALLEVVRKNASGNDTEANSSTLVDYQKATIYNTQEPGFALPIFDYSALYRKAHVLDVITLTSNAGGSLDADVNAVDAFSGYYGSFKILGIHSDGAETPTFVINGNATLHSFTTPAFTAGQVESFLTNALIMGDADNQAIYFDTTCANLGNVKTYKFFIERWYET